MEGLSNLWSGLSNLGSSISTGAGNLWDSITNIGTTSVPATTTADVASIATKASPSLWSALGSDAFKNISGLGVQGFGALQTADALKQAKKIQNAQLGMAQDAYARNKLADEARQKLTF